MTQGCIISSGIGPSTSIINEENILTDLLLGNLMETFSQLRFLFPDNSKFCQVEKKTQKTTKTQNQQTPHISYSHTVLGIFYFYQMILQVP